MSLMKRKIGASGLEVAGIGLGCMSLSGLYGANSDDDGAALLERAIDIGVDMLDTADAYGDGHNEELVGRAIKGQRSKIVIATKFGNLMGRGGKFADGRPETVARSCEASLKRLGIETIDLYYQHRIDPEVPIEETVGAMARLVEQGKVRALGLSEASPQTIRRAHAVHPIAAVQIEYSLVCRQPAEEVRQTTRELGIAFVAYSPLGRGLLTLRIRDDTGLAPHDARKRHPRFAPENLPHNYALAEQIAAVAREVGCSPSQLGLAWLLHQGDDVIPIPGTTSPQRLVENMGALSIELSARILKRLDEIAPAGAAVGLRYPEAQMKSVYL